MSTLSVTDEHFAQMQELAAIGSWELDVRTSDLRWSAECYRIFGIPVGTEMTYDRFLETVHPDDRAEVEAAWSAALDGAQYDIEHRIVVAGETRWVREKAEVTFEEGDPVRGIGVVQDITERIEHERGLQAARKRYRSLLDAAPDPVFIADAETGRLVEANRAAADLRGEPVESIVGRHQRELHPAGDREAYEASFARAVDTEEPQRTLPDGSPMVLATVDGETVPVSITVSTIELPDGPVIFGIFRDVSEQRRQERRLAAFHKAVEAAGHSIYVTDRTGTIQYVNPAFEETTGYTAMEAVGANPRILKSGEHGAAFYRELWSTILSGETWRSEIVNRRKSGERYHVDQTIAPITDEDGAITRFVAVNSDISARKDREAALAQERNHAHRLRQRLSVVNRVLRHDLRSGVNVIQGYADLASESAGSDDLLEPIVREADRLYRIGEKARLIEATISDGQERPTETDLSRVVGDAIADLQTRVPEAKVRADVPEGVAVRAHSHVKSAVDHVLENAVEHNDAAAPTVDVTLRETEAAVELVVDDDGPGIPEAEIEPLGQDIEGALRHSSGLGLWIVYWVVEESGGTVSFETRETGGTRVTLRLPPATSNTDA